MEIINRTVYDTEDIRALVLAARDQAFRESKKKVNKKRPDLPDALEVISWQGDRWRKRENVCRRVLLDVERRAHLLKIKPPHRLSVPAVELLGLAGSRKLPSCVVDEIFSSLVGIFSWSNRKRRTKLSVRIRDEPESKETKQERQERVKAKKVRKAVAAATYQGLRMGPTLAQAQDKVARLEAVEGLLNEDQAALLLALREEAAAMAKVLSAAEKLEETNTP